MLQKKSLTEVAEVIMGQSPPGDTYNFEEVGVPLLNGPTEFGSHHPFPVMWTSCPTKTSVQNDILFCVRGSTTGRMNWADQQYCLGRGLAAIRSRSGYSDAVYIYHILRHSLSELLSNTSGSVFPNISREDLSKFRLPWLPDDERAYVSKFLSALDDKIELNRQMNKTLEEMAQAIFKEWFVDFGPFRDGGMQDSELGPIPVGWKVGNISECCEQIQNGGTPLRSEPTFWTPATIPWLTSSEVRKKIIITTENHISQFGLTNSSAKWFKQGSTVVALYGATAGQVAYIASDMTSNQAVCGLSPIPFFQHFNYLSMSGNVHKLANNARGSAQQNISKGIVESTKIIIPPTSVAQKFEIRCDPFIKQIVSNLMENDTLSAIRDALLPKLMSGEIRFPVDAEPA